MGGIYLGTINSSQVYMYAASATTSSVLYYNTATKVVTYGAAPSGGLSGLTTTYVPVATSATTLGNSIMTANATGVGIGYATPTKTLHVSAGNPTISIEEQTSNNY